MRIANVILEGRFGGPQHRILQISARLRGLDVDTVVVIPTAHSELFATKLRAKGIDVRQLPLHRLQRDVKGNVVNAALLLPELAGLVRLLRRERIELVHCNSAWQVKPVVAARLAGCKVVLHLNDTWRAPYVRALFRILAPLAHGFILTGRRVRACYLADGRYAGTPAVEIQAPVDCSVFDPARTDPEPRLASRAGLKIVTVGNITPTKGLEHFVEMAGILSLRHVGLSYHIVGPELASQREYTRRLKELVARRGVADLEFFGQSTDVARILKAADVFVFTSLSESGPMAVWEAMAMERPIVSTDVGDVSVYVRDGDNGFVVQPGDSAVLADRVSRLVRDRELRLRFGKLARTVAERELDVDIAARRHRDFYESVLAAPRR